MFTKLSTQDLLLILRLCLEERMGFREFGHSVYYNKIVLHFMYYYQKKTISNWRPETCGYYYIETRLLDLFGDFVHQSLVGYRLYIALINFWNVRVKWNYGLSKHVDINPKISFTYFLMTTKAKELSFPIHLKLSLQNLGL